MSSLSHHVSIFRSVFRCSLKRSTTISCTVSSNEVWPGTKCYLIPLITTLSLWAERETKLQARRQECVWPKSLSRFDLKQHRAEDRCMTSKHRESYREQMELHAFEIQITLAVLWCHTHTARSARCCFKSNTPHLTSWSSEPVHFASTLMLTSACKHVVSVEVIHCEWSRHKIHNF